MKRTNLAAALLVLGVGVAWISPTAAQRATLGQPVTAVPRAEKAPTQHRQDRSEGINAPVSDNDGKRPESREQEQGPSRAFIEEQEGARHRD